MQPIVRLCIIAVALSYGYPKRSLQNRWHSVDNHFWKVVAMSSLALLPIKAANIVMNSVCYCTALEWSTIQDQKSLMFGWRSFLEDGSDIVAVLCAHNCSQCGEYCLTLSHSPGIIQNTTPEIGDPLSTLISKMVQWACRLPLYIYRQPNIPRSIDVTMQPIDWRKDDSKNIDALSTLTIVI
jgi:hypothetical protein